MERAFRQVPRSTVSTNFGRWSSRKMPEVYDKDIKEKLGDFMKRQLVTTLILIFYVGSANAAGDSSRSQTVRPTYKNYHRQPATAYHSDRDLQAMARRSLDRDTGFSDEARNVNIRVRDGRASIQGFVQSPEESDALKRKVMAIDGVHRVDDKTSVRE